MNSATRLLLELLVFCCCGLNGFSQTNQDTQTVPGPGIQKFDCVDARKSGFSDQLLLASVQALANERVPALFVIWRAEDLSWMNAMQRELRATAEMISADEALARFGATAPQVIYDSRQSWTVSLATTLAGVHRALLTDGKLEGHEIAFDCRNQWPNKIAAYQWALTNLLPKCDRNQFVYLDEALAPLRDFAIQQKLFVLNLDPLNNPQETQLLEQILAGFPSQATVFGWATGAYARKKSGQDGATVEFALVSRLSRHGLNLVAADFSGNFSFFDQTGPYAGKLKQPHLDRHLKFQRGKRYALLVNSDGDNLQYDLGVMREHWEEADRPKIPVAWTIAPRLTEVGPIVLQAYYREAAARGGWDEFIAGPSGAGYVNPGSMNPAHLRQFIQSTHRLCDAADLHAVAILDKGDRPPAQVAAFLNDYGRASVDGLWLIAMPQYVGVANGAAFLNERFRLDDRNAAEIARQVREVKLSDPFSLIYLDGWGTTGRALREFAAGLDDSCVLVSSTEMAGLIRQWVSAYAAMQQVEARPETTVGITPVNGNDGAFTTTEHNGIRCWLVPGRGTSTYFYLDVDGGFRGSAMDIELEYFDAGKGEIALDYDSTDMRAPIEGAYKRHPSVIHRTGGAQWQLAHFRINDARFANRENGGSDFRFCNAGDELLIRAVRVRRANP